MSQNFSQKLRKEFSSYEFLELENSGTDREIRSKILSHLPNEKQLLTSVNSQIDEKIIDVKSGHLISRTSLEILNDHGLLEIIGDNFDEICDEIVKFDSKYCSEFSNYLESFFESDLVIS